jgi:hypothetical protein
MFGNIYFSDKTGHLVYGLEKGILCLKGDIISEKIVDGSGLFEGLDRKIAKYVEKLPASRIDTARCEAFRETREKLLEEIKVLKKRLGDDFVANEFTEREIGCIFDLDTEYMRTMNRYFECLDELEETRSQSNNSGLITDRYAFWELKDDILEGITSNLEVFSWVDFSKGLVDGDVLNSLLDSCKTAAGFVDGYYKTSKDILGNGVTLDDLKFRVVKVLDVLNKLLVDYGVALVFDMKERDSESILWGLSWDISCLDEPVECKQYFEIDRILEIVVGGVVSLLGRGIKND